MRLCGAIRLTTPRRAAGGPTFNPATLSLTGWWRASYTGVPWAPTASAGTSGSNGNLVANVNAPSVGTAVNSYTPAVCGGASAGTAKGLESVTDAGSLLTASAGTVLGLAKITGLSAPGATWNLDTRPLFGGANFGIRVSTSGVRAGWNDFGAIYATGFRAVSVGAYVAAAMTWSGTNVTLRVGSWSASVTRTTGIASWGVLRAGKLISSSVATDCEVLEMMSANTALSDANITRIFDEYFAPRYGVTLA